MRCAKKVWVNLDLSIIMYFCDNNTTWSPIRCCHLAPTQEQTWKSGKVFTPGRLFGVDISMLSSCNHSWNRTQPSQQKNASVFDKHGDLAPWCLKQSCVYWSVSQPTKYLVRRTIIGRRDSYWVESRRTLKQSFLSNIFILHVKRITHNFIWTSIH